MRIFKFTNRCWFATLAAQANMAHKCFKIVRPL